MKILLLTQSTSGGGAERVLTHLANGFAERGYNVTYAALYMSGYYNLDSRVQKKVISSRSNCQAFVDLFRLKRFLRKNRYDTIICFGYPVSIKYALCSLFHGSTKVIMSERNDPTRNVHSKIMRLLRNWAYSKSNVVVFQTEEARSFFPLKISKKSHIIPNPLIISRELCKKDKTSRIIALGRISPQKNFSILIQAFSQVIKEFPQMTLVIFGAEEKKESEKLNSLIVELNLQNKVFLSGFTDDVYKELENSALYVSSSDYEGISNSVMEAMACGLPVVCTDCPCGGNKILISNNYNGVLVPVGNNEILAKEIIRVLKNPALQRTLGENARDSIGRFSLNSIMDLWEQLM